MSSQAASRELDTKPYRIGESLLLPASGSWPASAHLFDADAVYALLAAEAARRPLLIRGEPGTGKSQLARAAAQKLQRAFVSTVVHARSEPQELQWRFDAVARLGEAQALGAGGKASGAEDAISRLEPRHFLSPGPLWWVFDWGSAKRQHDRCRHPEPMPDTPPGWSAEQGAVLLIDEIDKADADLPNGLLETLGNGAFSVPYRKQPVGLAEGAKAPLVIITTNAERELPPAFLRRCLVLSLQVPADEQEFCAWLQQRAAAHEELDCEEPVRREAATQLWRDRQNAIENSLSKPGLAEYIDLLRALTHLAPDNPDRQRAWLDKIAGYTFVKHSREE